MQDTPQDISTVENTAAHTASVQSPLKMIITNLPEILMIALTIWVLDLSAIFSFVGIFHAGLTLALILALLFSLPALWATWQTFKLALTPPMTAGLPATSQTD